jgi:hypothetical protein
MQTTVCAGRVSDFKKDPKKGIKKLEKEGPVLEQVPGCNKRRS